MENEKRILHPEDYRNIDDYVNAVLEAGGREFGQLDGSHESSLIKQAKIEWRCYYNCL